MIRLTDATKTNKHGEVVDSSLYLVRFDSRNLAIIEGLPTQDSSGRSRQNVRGYYGSVRTALIKSIDIAIKDGGDGGGLLEMLERIDNLTQHIETACAAHNLPSMMKLLRGETNE